MRRTAAREDSGHPRIAIDLDGAAAGDEADFAIEGESAPLWITAMAEATLSLAEASNQKATLYIVSPSGKPVWCSDGGVDPGRLATTSAVVSACVAIASINEIDAGDRKIVIDRRGELIFVASGARESAAEGADVPGQALSLELHADQNR